MRRRRDGNRGSGSDADRCSDVPRFSDHTQFHAAFFGNHILIPGRIPDKFDLRIIDSLDRHDACLGIRRDHRAHATPGSRQSHFDHRHGLASLILDEAVVNQTEIDDIHRDFRIVDRLQLRPDLFFERGVLEFDRLLLLPLLLLRVNAQIERKLR